MLVRLNITRFHSYKIPNKVVAIETEPLIPQLLISEGLENVSLSIFIEHLLSFDQNLPYFLVFSVLINGVTSSGLSWQLD